MILSIRFVHARAAQQNSISPFHRKKEWIKFKNAIDFDELVFQTINKSNWLVRRAIGNCDEAQTFWIYFFTEIAQTAIWFDDKVGKWMSRESCWNSRWNEIEFTFLWRTWHNLNDFVSLSLWNIFIIDFVCNTLHSMEFNFCSFVKQSILYECSLTAWRCVERKRRKKRSMSTHFVRITHHIVSWIGYCGLVYTRHEYVNVLAVCLHTHENDSE